MPGDISVSPQSKPRSAQTVTAAVLLIMGGAIALFALLADRLGIGMGDGFGYQQMIVFIIGLVMLLGGLRLLLSPWINRLGTRDPAES
jgi:predicted phage tail protein